MGRTRTERWDLKSTVYMWSYSSHWGYKTVCLFYEGKGFMVWWMSRNHLRGLFMLDRLMHCLQHSAWRQTVWSVVWHSKVQELCTKNTERNVFRQMHKSGYFWLFFFSKLLFFKGILLNSWNSFFLKMGAWSQDCTEQHKSQTDI